MRMMVLLYVSTISLSLGYYRQIPFLIMMNTIREPKSDINVEEN